MAATISKMLLITLPSDEASLFHITMFTFFFFLIFTLYAILKSKNKDNGCKKEPISNKIQSFPVNDDENAAQQQKQGLCLRPDPENLAHSLLLEILPSNSPKWDTLLSKGKDFDNELDEINGSGREEKKRKKKRVKKKRPGPIEEEKKNEFVCLYPFTKSCSATQRKIKQHYDKLVKAHGLSKGLTLDQIGQFINCLVEARNELQHKSDVIKRRFTITKALLCKADRSSFDRLRQQIHKLELEQKRLEEDAFVYNWLQEQLKISPAYKKMLEIGACVEMKKKSRHLVESTDDDLDFSNISFEELLAQEKKDAFWQRNGRLKTCLG